ncbi:Ig-like domain-containing protein [Deinococcus sp.]|uniref:DUF937 domain-containing protein n=1 Tax=Deinococcus sp. TaxID=47478 RepID=UPI0025DA1B29|nr:Ig-like domain-containing protein [Deinococcus sp.]
MDIQEYLKEHLSVPVVAALGASLGLRATQSARIADEVLPGQLDALSALSRTPEGAQKLLDLTRDRIPAGSVDTLTGSPEALARLQQVGAELLPEAMGTGVDTEVQRLANATGTDAPTVRRMMELLLPLLLSLIGHRATSDKLTAATLGTLFGGAALTGTAAAPVAVLTSTPDVVVERAAPVPAPLPPKLVTRPAQEEPRRRTPVWWLLPLALLLGVGGCYLSQRNQTGLALTQPAEGASVTGPVTLSGTGKAGETVTVSENGTSLTTAQVAADGAFSATVPAPAAGSHTYAVTESGTSTALSRTVTATAATVDTSDATAQTPSSTAPDSTVPSSAADPASSAATTPSSVTAAPSTDLAFTAPASGRVPAGALSLTGTGPADTDLSITEDGNTLGTARTDASGAWTFSVPSPSAGAHTYTATTGSATSELKLTVAAGTAQTGSCTKPFSLSLRDGAQVKQPFRFGGEGSGKSYTVTVSRGTRQIGQKVLPLDASCSYSYTSKPGVGRITYALKENGQSAAARTITLNVTR